MIKSFEKICCICVTQKNRYNKIKRAIECFKQQTYKYKELIIIIDEMTKEDELDFKNHEDNNITTILISKKYNLGTLRNIGLHCSFGNIVCQWDDDDLSTKNRLEIQYKFMIKNKLNYSFLTKQFHVDEINQKAYIEDWSKNKILPFIPGTLMFRNINEKIKYKDLVQSEDTEFAKTIIKEKKVGFLNSEIYYIYFFHGNNSYNRTHHEGIWKSLNTLEIDINELKSNSSFNF